MTLKVKLLAGFLIMLLLIGLTVATGWWSMGRMDNQAQVSNGVENTLTKVLEAQERQLTYLINRDKAIASELNADLKAAAETLKATQVLMVTPENIRMSREVDTFLQWYQQAFTTLVQIDEAAKFNENEMTKIATPITATFEKLITNTEQAIRSGNSTPATMDALKGVTDAHMAFLRARLAARNFAGSPTAANAKVAEDQQAKAQQQLKAARETLRVPENIALTQDLERLIQEYSAFFVKMRDGSIRSDQQASDIRSKLVSISETLHNLSLSAMGTVVNAKDSGTNILFIAAIIALLAGLGIALYLSGNVEKQLGKDPSQLASIAQRVTEGDYAIDDGSRRIGVYGNLVSMVDALRKHIENAQQESERAQIESTRAREAMHDAEEASRQAKVKTDAILEAAGRLENVANIVSSASSELAAQIEQSERGASEQASRVTETVTAMEEMNATVIEVAQNAANAATVSASTREKAESGARVVQNAVESIQQVQRQASMLKEDMARLDENARAISQIMGVISDIADQTNLLALNAAIEAARAGEAGRGFAVVADEVRKLAEKTMASTTDVGNAIRAIQQSASQSMSQVEQSATYIEHATDFANQSGAALSEIVSMVDNTADQVRAIATASEQQAASSEEINSSIVQVNTIASETARAMQEAASAVSDLANQAQVLSGLIDDMKKI